MNENMPDTPFQQNGAATDPARPRHSETGTIKNYQAEKGFGFIARDAGSDLFFHVTDLIDASIPVQAGQKVRFSLEPSKRKPGTFVAIQVQRYQTGTG